MIRGAHRSGGVAGQGSELRSNISVAIDTLGEGGQFDPQGEIHLFRVIQDLELEFW